MDKGDGGFFNKMLPGLVDSAARSEGVAGDALYEGRKVELKKHSAVIQMSNRINVTQRKAYNVLIYAARAAIRQQPNARLFKIPLVQIKDLAGIRSTNNKELKDNLVALMKTIVELNLLKKDQAEWQACTLLAEAKIANGYLHFGFAPTIHDTLTSPIPYTTLDLAIMRGLKSKYALCLYELAKDYINASIPPIPIDEFRKLIGLEPTQYTNGKDLRRSIIEPAVKEISEVTDILLGYELLTEKKRISHVKFTASQKGRERLPSYNELGRLCELLPLAVRELKGVRRMVEDAYRDHGTAYVESNIAFMLARERSNPRQFLKNCFEEDLGIDLRTESPVAPIALDVTPSDGIFDLDLAEDLFP